MDFPCIARTTPFCEPAYNPLWAAGSQIFLHPLFQSQQRETGRRIVAVFLCHGLRSEPMDTFPLLNLGQAENIRLKCGPQYIHKLALLIFEFSFQYLYPSLGISQ